MADIAAESWEVLLSSSARTLDLAWGGSIDHPLEAVGEEYARGQRETRGTIAAEGVFLSGASGWYPRFEGCLFLTFALRSACPRAGTR